MANFLLLAAAIIVACVIFQKISSRLGVPSLLAFILLGMLFGSDGLMKIPFDDYALAEQLCSVALIFIMFYGGFGTKWRQARPVALKAGLLSSLGTVLTAGLVGLFCWLALRMEVLESFLIGAVISSTDAASVFSILRSRRLNLKDNTASLLEIESGSNDPFSYMLTVILLSLMGGDASPGGFAYAVFAQLVYGAAFGVGIAALAIAFLRRFHFAADGFCAVFLVAVALLAYAAPAAVGGNGYLSAYLAGILLGNAKIPNKGVLVNFFDGTTGMMQMLLFFTLGLLAFPSSLPAIAPTALLIALFLTFVARPAAVFAILSPFRCGVRQRLLVSWAGMRGAASIVFAIMVTVDPASTSYDIFHIVFSIVLFSILLQGSLIPPVARALRMTDPSADVMKTFTDYTDEVPVQLIQFAIPAEHPWAGCTVAELPLPPDTLLVLVLRGHEKTVPNGSTVILPGDTLVLSGKASVKIDGVRLYEKVLEPGDELIGKTPAELTENDRLIMMICRGGGIVIPNGSTTLRENDVLVMNETGNA